MPESPAASTSLALVYALRHIANWPFDVNKSAEDDLREIKDFAQRTLDEVE